jgi:hypothetical protein
MVGHRSFGTRAALAAASLFWAASGCTRSDFRITSLTVTRNPNNNIVTYTYTIENRDWGGNALVRPGPFSGEVAMQAYWAPGGVPGPSPAGGWVIDFSDPLQPGQSHSAFGTGTYSNALMPSHVVITIDPSDQIEEYSEDNNQIIAPVP